MGRPNMSVSVIGVQIHVESEDIRGKWLMMTHRT